jgi:branched-chain amino acid transport system permease protein
VDNLYRVKGLPLPVAIITTIAVVAVFAYVYDLVVLRLAQDGRRPIEGIVITFFFTFALSFFIDGVAKSLFGTDVHAAPTLWGGRALTVGSLNFARSGILVLACAVIIGGAFWVYIKFTLGGKALEASGENSIGARIVGIDTRQFRRLIFIGTAVIAAVFGIVESPITGFTYLSGATISLTGFLAAAYGGFRKPGRALVAGLFIGVLEALLLGYVSSEYGDTVLYAILAAMILAWPRGLGFESAVTG